MDADDSRGSRARRETDNGGDQPERRRAGEQRRYNRRSPVSDVPPPYYETFERIASALERIEVHLARLEAGASGRAGVVPPARAGEQP